jgi:hypothetical protein
LLRRDRRDLGRLTTSSADSASSIPLACTSSMTAPVEPACATSVFAD